jgi:hypothetical protein
MSILDKVSRNSGQKKMRETTANMRFIMMPHVILFNGMSLDGRIDGFAIDLGQFYELAASRWREDATLVGSDTILRAE